MPAAKPPVWKRLPLSVTSNLPSHPLFFKLQRHESGLKLLITDLIHIWTAAKTSKQDLINEATRTRCSIDPSEDEEQYEVLVAKLQEAVSGLNETRVCYFRDDEQATTPAAVGFEITISMPLPGPLGMLDWTFRIISQETLVLTRELVLPSLRAVDASRRREEELRRKIKEKDHVIGKLMDKIEGAGIDLGVVFPGFIGARKGLSSRQAAKVVPGVEAFRGEEWEKEVGSTELGGIKGIVEELEDIELDDVGWSGATGFMRGYNGTEQGDLKQSPLEGTMENQRSDLRPTSHDDDSDSSEAPGRYHTEVPPSRSSSSSSAHIRSREPSSKPRAVKLGTLGGAKSKPITVPKRKSPSPSPFLEPEQPSKGRRRLSSSSTDTATTSESEPARGPTAAGSRTATPKKPVSKIGTIEGKKPQVSSKEKTMSPETPAETSQNTPSKGKSRLGAIGGKKAKTASPPRHEGSSTASPSPPPPPRLEAGNPVTTSTALPNWPVTPTKAEEPMTEAERANQKRLELKRQLDEGAGRKKKRKF